MEDAVDSSRVPVIALPRFGRRLDRREGLMRLRLLGLIVGLTTLSGAVLIATTSPAGANFEFTVIEHTTNVEYAVGNAAPSVTPPHSALGPGDRIILRHDFLQDGTNVGFNNVVCTVTFNDNVLCDVMLAFTNKGDLHASVLIRGQASSNPPSVFDAVIDGGTFNYRNAHGDAHIVNLPNGDAQVTFDLVTQ
jgi:hypothetical protein